MAPSSPGFSAMVAVDGPKWRASLCPRGLRRRRGRRGGSLSPLVPQRRPLLNLPSSPSPTPQVASHAQKWFMRLARRAKASGDRRFLQLTRGGATAGAGAALWDARHVLAAQGLTLPLDPEDQWAAQALRGGGEGRGRGRRGEGGGGGWAAAGVEPAAEPAGVGAAAGPGTKRGRGGGGTEVSGRAMTADASPPPGRPRARARRDMPAPAPMAAAPPAPTPPPFPVPSLWGSAPNPLFHASPGVLAISPPWTKAVPRVQLPSRKSPPVAAPVARSQGAPTAPPVPDALGSSGGSGVLPRAQGDDLAATLRGWHVNPMRDPASGSDTGAGAAAGASAGPDGPSVVPANSTVDPANPTAGPAVAAAAAGTSPAPSASRLGWQTPPHHPAGSAADGARGDAWPASSSPDPPRGATPPPALPGSLGGGWAIPGSVSGPHTRSSTPGPSRPNSRVSSVLGLALLDAAWIAGGGTGSDGADDGHGAVFAAPGGQDGSGVGAETNAADAAATNAAAAAALWATGAWPGAGAAAGVDGTPGTGPALPPLPGALPPPPGALTPPPGVLPRAAWATPRGGGGPPPMM